MAEDQLKSFLQEAKYRASLQDKIEYAQDTEDLIYIAKKDGFRISIEDLKRAHVSFRNKSGWFYDFFMSHSEYYYDKTDGRATLAPWLTNFVLKLDR
jgi:predicted ribosomally synthesized peptide with nif11-like leader